MKKIFLTIFLTQITLQFPSINFPNIALPISKTPIQQQLGSLYSKISNKQDIITSQKAQKFTKSKTAQKNFISKCRMRTGRKSTHYTWNGNHPFVTGSGSREIWYFVPFSSAFPYGNPIVEVALYGLDVNKDRNLRITASVVWKSIVGFVLKISTWADTKVYFAGYSYNAHHGCE